MKRALFLLSAVIFAVLNIGCDNKPSDDEGIPVPEEWTIFNIQDYEGDDYRRMRYFSNGIIDVYWAFHKEDSAFWSLPMKIYADESLTPLKFVGGNDEFDCVYTRPGKEGGLYCMGSFAQIGFYSPEFGEEYCMARVRLPEPEGTFDFALICETDSGIRFRSSVYRITARLYTDEELGMKNDRGWTEVKIEKVGE